MTVAQFVGKLAAAGAWFSIEEDGVRYHGPRRLLTDELRAFVEAHREELVALLLKSEGALTDAELAALDIQREEPGTGILRDADGPEWRAWTPSPDSQPERDEREARP